jgi:hypothetical protein
MRYAWVGAATIHNISRAECDQFGATVMNIHLRDQFDTPGRTADIGMGRFFSSANLGRYRRLAGEKIDADERKQVLRILAEEWSAFMRECHVNGATHVRFFPKHLPLDGATRGRRMP